MTHVTVFLPDSLQPPRSKPTSFRASLRNRSSKLIHAFSTTTSPRRCNASLAPHRLPTSASASYSPKSPSRAQSPGPGSAEASMSGVAYNIGDVVELTPGGYYTGEKVIDADGRERVEWNLIQEEQPEGSVREMRIQRTLRRARRRLSAFSGKK